MGAGTRSDGGGGGGGGGGGVTLAMHVVGFALSTLGFGLTVMVIYLNCWSIYSHGPGTYMQSGLWNICMRNASTERGEVCRQFYTTLSQPRFFQVVRALMLMAVAVGAIALFVSTLGTACARRFSEHASTKTKLTCAGGALWLLSGLCVMLAVSLYANFVVKQLYNPLEPYGVRPARAHEGVGGQHQARAAFVSLVAMLTRTAPGSRSVLRCTPAGWPAPSSSSAARSWSPYSSGKIPSGRRTDSSSLTSSRPLKEQANQQPTLAEDTSRPGGERFKFKFPHSSNPCPQRRLREQQCRLKRAANAEHHWTNGCLPPGSFTKRLERKVGTMCPNDTRVGHGGRRGSVSYRRVFGVARGGRNALVPRRVARGCRGCGRCPAPHCAGGVGRGGRRGSVSYRRVFGVARGGRNAVVPRRVARGCRGYGRCPAPRCAGGVGRESAGVGGFGNSRSCRHLNKEELSLRWQHDFQGWRGSGHPTPPPILRGG
ncbi:unnamed protein product [Lampetra fluviatilis]